MRILVIGGSGSFIGAGAVRELAGRGHEVAAFGRVAPSQEGVRHFAGDRRRLAEAAAALQAFAPDVVLDVILSSDAQARELMGIFRGVARRVVALSSMDVYRACGVLHRLEPGPLEPLPLAESSPVRTRLQIYPPTQIAALQRIFGWLDDQYDKIPVERVVLGDPSLPGTVLRLPLVYGPGDKLHRFLPVLKRIDDGRRAILMADEFARWRGTKGYVDNVAAAVALATVSERASGRIYNVGEADAPTELEWGRAIANATGWTGEFVIVPADRAPAHLRAPGNYAQHWVADTSRIRAELGYAERIGREEALRHPDRPYLRILKTIDRPSRSFSFCARPIATIAYSTFSASKRCSNRSRRPAFFITSADVILRPLNRRLTTSSPRRSTALAL
jgi:nucleoside-diphosphate-sugar epimerase